MISMLTGLTSSEACLFGLQMAVFSSLCFCMLFRLCMSVPATSLYTDARLVGLGPIYMTSLYCNDLFKGPISKYSYLLR